MQFYKNIGGNSGVRAFDIGEDYIEVQFSTGRVYRYSYGKAGKRNVEEMKRLALLGCGLNSYIMRNVKNDYDR